MTMLLVQCKAYADNTATTPGISRVAIASIELMHTRIIKNLSDLKGKLAATKIELSLRLKGEASEDLEEWINQAGTLEAHLKSLRTALTQRVLGKCGDIPLPLEHDVTLTMPTLYAVNPI